MKTRFARAPLLAVLSLALMLLPAVASAQQTPLTGQMRGLGNTLAAAATPAATAPPRPSSAVTTPLGSAAAAAPPASRQSMDALPAPAYGIPSDTAPPVVARSRPQATVVGETTRYLLQMQADGTRAGRHLPMLGAEASASYDRYMKSFSHDIPEFYKTTVGKDGSGSAGGE